MSIKTVSFHSEVECIHIETGNNVPLKEEVSVRVAQALFDRPCPLRQEMAGVAKKQRALKIGQLERDIRWQHRLHSPEEVTRIRKELEQTAIEETRAQQRAEIEKELAEFENAQPKSKLDSTGFILVGLVASVALAIFFGKK